MSESSLVEKVGALYAVVIDANDLETCGEF